MRPKQTSFFKSARRNTKKYWIENQSVYGGSLNYRKCSRPFDSKKLVHVVFKGRLGKSIWFTRSQRSIVEILLRASHRYQVRIKNYSIQKNHIHVLCYPASTAVASIANKNFKNFLRFFACEMGRNYKNVFKKFGITKSQNLWSHRPFTRLVSWGKRSLEKVFEYIEKNEKEALGLVEYTPRYHQLNKFLKTWSQEWQT